MLNTLCLKTKCGFRQERDPNAILIVDGALPVVVVTSMANGNCIDRPLRQSICVGSIMLVCPALGVAEVGGSHSCLPLSSAGILTLHQGEEGGLKLDK